jgi:hypothetical protein
LGRASIRTKISLIEAKLEAFQLVTSSCHVMRWSEDVTPTTERSKRKNIFKKLSQNTVAFNRHFDENYMFV